MGFWENLKVIFYVPNLVDYSRFVFLWIGCNYYFVEGDEWMFASFYLLSYALDIIDGPLARSLGQTSKLGVYLDMVADRISSCVLLYLAFHSIYVNKLSGQLERGLELFFYQVLAAAMLFCLVFVEILAHTAVMIQSEKDHIHQKELSLKESYVVRLYLTNRSVLFLSCAFFELAGLSLVLNLHIAFFLICMPLFCFRALANLLRLSKAVTSFKFKPE